MKHLLITLSAGAMMMVACQTAPEADNAATSEEQAAAAATGDTLSVDVTGSTIGWIGTKTGGQHNGTFQISNGFLTVADGNLTGGAFDINVASLSVLDLTGEDKGKLEGHLKSADFFLVDSFPTARFEITNVAAFDSATATTKLEGATHTISGNLTLRGQTNNVTFPAIVKLEGNNLTAVADFNIDRTSWGLVYKGPNNPADWFIAKEVNLKLDVKAASGSL
ncbi:MAG: YceI family protein [Chitinophagaceae bacterium]|jgi:polyisoprenoid-binding protein YceI|nr:YceI family protein [Chitinophagaceae bacterium]MCU0404305.1 YceI family protein [Chitinophagaceae bacterium]